MLLLPKLGHIGIGHSVHVFLRRNGEDDTLLADMLGQGHLNQYAVHVIVFIETVYGREDILLAAAFRQTHYSAIQSRPLRILLAGCHVARAAIILADQHDTQTGYAPILLTQ